ncbi:MAG: SagB/ThcOx family dehydrogenase [Planctomycetota bacterium]
MTEYLTSPKVNAGVDLFAAMRSRKSVRKYSSTAVDLDSLSTLLYYTCGRVSDTPKRLIPPSAGNIHAIKCYVLSSKVAELRMGLYVYDNASHSLELVSEGDLRQPLCNACLNQSMIALAPLCIILAADIGRIAIRYRDRAERYAAMDCGHYGHSLYLACEALGLGTVAVGAFDDAAVSKVLQLPENLSPMYVFPVGCKE